MSRSKSILQTSSINLRSLNSRYRLGDVQSERLPGPCSTGNPVSCRQVRRSELYHSWLCHSFSTAFFATQVATDCDAILGADEFELNGVVYGSTERNIESAGAMISFMVSLRT